MLNNSGTSGKFGIKISGEYSGLGQRNVVSGNTVRTALAFDAIAVGAPAGSVSPGGNLPCNNCVIVGNAISATGSLACKAISFNNGSTGCVATGNTITGGFASNGAQTITAGSGNIVAWNTGDNQTILAAALPASQGGTAIDSSSSTGMPVVNSGTWSVASGATVTTTASGTAYSLTNTSAAVDFTGGGSVDPVITIPATGTYKVKGHVNLYFNGATFASDRTVTLKLRRTNNTAGDLTNAVVTLHTGVVTTLTATWLVIDWEADDYTTANSNDALTIFADVGVAPTAGSLQVVEAKITAKRSY